MNILVIAIAKKGTNKNKMNKAKAEIIVNK